MPYNDSDSTGDLIKRSAVLPYLLTVGFMSLLIVIAVLVITYLRPTADNTALIATVVGALVPTTVAILGFVKGSETHSAVNGRLSDFVATAKRSAYEEGLRDATTKVGVAVTAVPSSMPDSALTDRLAKLEAQLAQRTEPKE